MVESFADLNFVNYTAFDAEVTAASGVGGEPRCCWIKSKACAIQCHIDPEFVDYSLLARRSDDYWLPNSMEEIMISKEMQCKLHTSSSSSSSFLPSHIVYTPQMLGLATSRGTSQGCTIACGSQLSSEACCMRAWAHRECVWGACCASPNGCSVAMQSSTAFMS